jgi:hypothetical protein
MRIRNISNTVFNARVIEEEGQDSIHANETMHFIALTTGVGAINGASIAVGRTGSTISSNWSSVSFVGSYPSPLLFASTQVSNGNDPVVLRHRNLLPNQFDVFLEEEQSADAEVVHVGESIGWLVISSP